MALVKPGDPGTDRSIVIDRHVFQFQPGEMTVVPRRIEDRVDLMDSGSKLFTIAPYFDGVANTHTRYEIDFPYGSLKGADLEAFDDIDATGGVHLVAIWKLRPAIYIASGLTDTFYFPRYRRNAAQVFAGLVLSGGAVVSTANFPVYAWRDDDVLTPVYANGPASLLAAPGADEISVAAVPEVIGDALGYTGFRLGAVPAAGTRIKVLWCPAFEMFLGDPEERMRGTAESRRYPFIER